MISGFWRSCCLALHCITWHLELCREPMVVTVPVQHHLLGITMQLHTLLGMKAGVHMHTSLVWHRDAASFLDGYKGRSSYSLICIFFGLMLDVMEICCYLHILQLMKVWYIRRVPFTFICFIVWIFGYWWIQLQPK